MQSYFVYFSILNNQKYTLRQNYEDYLKSLTFKHTNEKLKNVGLISITYFLEKKPLISWLQGFFPGLGCFLGEEAKVIPIIWGKMELTRASCNSETYGQLLPF